MPPAGLPRTSWLPVWRKKCEVQLAYAIGVAQPVSILVDTFGTGKYNSEELEAAVRKVFEIRALLPSSARWSCASPATVRWLPMATWVVRIWCNLGAHRPGGSPESCLGRFNPYA